MSGLPRWVHGRIQKVRKIYIQEAGKLLLFVLTLLKNVRDFLVQLTVQIS